MTGLPATLARLRHKAERASVLPRGSFKPAFLEAMGVIEQQQVEIERLLQAVANGRIKAGELTSRVVDLERRLNLRQ